MRCGWALAASICGLGLLAAPSGLLAQGVQEPGTEAREERSVQMSEQIYRRLTAVHELLGEGRLDDALSRLQSLQGMRLSPYEEALMHQTFGFVFAQQERYDEAIRSFERCLALDALPNIAQQGMLYSLAGLYAAEGQFEKAIDTMSTWFRYAEEPVPADAYMLVGSSYAQLERLAEALPNVQEANRRAEPPNESWHMLELSIHFELQDYMSAAALLREMVVLWPGRARLWEMLASTYLELEDDANALATLMVAYKKGLIEEEPKILNLVRLNLFQEVPYEAGQILDAELARGRVSESKEHLELLLSAWTAAREFDRALEVIDRLAPLAEDGEYYLRKAQLLSEQGEWAGVVEAAEQALEKGGLDETGTVYVLMGMAHAELGAYQAALAAFEQARSADDSARRNAEAWIEYVRDRQRVALAEP